MSKEATTTMDVKLRDPDDERRLEELIRAERNAKQRERYRAALLATQDWQSPQIVTALGRSRRFVQAWACRERWIRRARLLTGNGFERRIDLGKVALVPDSFPFGVGWQRFGDALQRHKFLGRQASIMSEPEELLGQLSILVHEAFGAAIAILVGPSELRQMSHDPSHTAKEFTGKSARP